MLTKNMGNIPPYCLRWLHSTADKEIPNGNPERPLRSCSLACLVQARVPARLILHRKLLLTMSHLLHSKSSVGDVSVPIVQIGPRVQRTFP